MISKIEVNSTATFQGVQILDDLKKFNYFFGANGTGKTTISRVIDAPDDYSSCSISWENQTPLETRVYNRNFVIKNFNHQKLPGVFTLGEMEQETLNKIGLTKEDIKKLKGEIENLKNKLQGENGDGGKKLLLTQLTQTYKAKFFVMKQKYADKLSGSQSGEGMKGSIGSQDSFMNKVIAESTSNTATLLTQIELEEKAKTVFSNALATVNLLTEISPAEILHHEKNPILEKRIIGKEDVDISAMSKTARPSTGID